MPDILSLQQTFSLSRSFITSTRNFEPLIHFILSLNLKYVVRVKGGMKKAPDYYGLQQLITRYKEPQYKPMIDV